MSIASDSGFDMAAMSDDLAILKRNVTSLIEHLKLNVTDGVQAATEGLDTGVRGLCHDAAAGGERSIKAVGRQIGAHPVLAMLVVLGAGYIRGRLLSK